MTLLKLVALVVECCFFGAYLDSVFKCALYTDVKGHEGVFTTLFFATVWILFKRSTTRLPLVLTVCSMYILAMTVSIKSKHYATCY